jgi:hypothetical protein
LTTNQRQQKETPAQSAGVSVAGMYSPHVGRHQAKEFQIVRAEQIGMLK